MQEMESERMDDHMTERNSFTRGDIESISQALDAAQPPARPMTKAEALDALAPQLKAARDRGHTIAGLVEHLAAQGLKTHPRAVSQAIGRVDAVKPARGRKARGKTEKTEGAQSDAAMRQQLEAAGQQRLPT